MKIVRLKLRVVPVGEQDFKAITVYDPKGEDSENHSFWEATPVGELWFRTLNIHAIESLKEMGEYVYVDISSAPEPNHNG